jgi:HAMP domain-containing protein
MPEIDPNFARQPINDAFTMDTVQGPEEVGTLPIGFKANTNSNDPQQVGRYQVSERIGRGGMASVFKAFDPSIDRVIAIKFLHADFCSDEGYRSRFLRESRAAGKLSHPNIVAVYDVGEIDGRPFIAMELVEGEPFNEIITRTGPLSIRDTVETGLQLALALDYAHGKGLVHRDIKPANVMRLKDGQTVKVMDFGIAHFSSDDFQETRVGDVLGTPQYMSPEQTQGTKVDGRSDLFSAGVMLFCMLTGRAPFQGDSLIALGMKIVYEAPPPLDKLRPDTPVALQRIVARCLEKQVEARYQTGGELALALRQVLREMDGEANRPEEPARVPLRLKWAVVMAAFVLVVMSLTGAFIHQQQNAAMMTQVADYGASLGRIIAAESAASALSDEWPAIEVSVQEFMKTGDFANIHVMDSNGIVKASSVEALVDKPYAPTTGEALGSVRGGVKVRRYSQNDENVLGFLAPITFQGKSVGLVDMGIAERPLVSVARRSLMLMGILVLVTVLAVAIAMYYITNWFTGPIKMLRRSMRELEQGKFEHRITEERKDEYGLLYLGFNNMADAMQRRFRTDSQSASETGQDKGILPDSLPPAGGAV